MANKSDEIIKRELLDIGDVGNLKLRVFPGGSREDQKHWGDGGLSFGYDNIYYGSCDGAWYLEKEWQDPLSKKACHQAPVFAVEGTLALERGSAGNAQYQRFFHVLGAVLSGVTGIYYLRAGKDALRYDMPKAALNASEMHKIDYLIINDINDLRKLIESCATENIKKYQDVVTDIKRKMEDCFKNVFDKRFKGDLEKYFTSRSIIRLPNINIKYLGGNFRNFTEGSQRGGHVILGEFLMAKYILREPFYFLLPRLLPEEVKQLDKYHKKEWLVLRNDKMGKLITLDDLDGVNPKLKKLILSLKNQPLGGSKQGGKAKHKWGILMKRLDKDIRQGIIKIK